MHRSLRYLITLASLYSLVACTAQSSEPFTGDESAQAVLVQRYYGKTSSILLSSSLGLEYRPSDISSARFLLEEASFAGSPGRIYNLQFSSVPLVKHNSDEFNTASEGCGANDYCKRIVRGTIERSVDEGTGAISFLGIELPSVLQNTDGSYGFGSGGFLSNVTLSLVNLLDELEDGIDMGKITDVVKTRADQSIFCEGTDYEVLKGSVFVLLTITSEPVPGGYFKPVILIETQTHLNLAGDSCDNADPISYHFQFDAVLDPYVSSAALQTDTN